MMLMATVKPYLVFSYSTKIMAFLANGLTCRSGGSNDVPRSLAK